MLFVIFLALASSGLVAQAQLPSTQQQWSAVRGGFASELKIASVNQNVRWFASVGPHFVFLSEDSAKKTTLTVLKGSGVVFSIKDGDARLRGTLFGNRAVDFASDWIGNKIVFATWCGERVTPTGTIKELCQLIELDVPSKRLTEIAYVGKTIATTFNGRKTLDWSIARLGMASISPTGTYVTMDLAKGSLVTNGLFRIESTGITQLISNSETPGHKYVSVDGSATITTPDGKKIYYEENLAPNGSNLRVYDIDKKSYDVVLGPGQSVDGYRLAPYYEIKMDFFNKSVYVQSGVISAVAEVNPKLRLLYRPNQNVDGVQLTTSGLFTSNGLTGFTAKTSSSGGDYTQAVIGSNLMIDSQDVVGGKKVERLDATAPTTNCRAIVSSVDKNFFNQMLIDVRPVFVRSLTGSSDGKTARVSGCFNIEGTALDSVTIGGATAEVVRRGVDPDGYDYIEVRPLSPVYGGANEVAVVVNGKRFASTISINGPDRPKIEIVNGASFEPKLAPQTLATLRGTATGKVAVSSGVAQYNLGGANIFACGQPARLLYNSGTSINFLVPKDVKLGECEVVLFLDSREIARTKVELELYAPAIFTFTTEDGTTLPIATFTDEEDHLWYVGPKGLSTLPAMVGQVVTLWLTGAGPTFPEVQDSSNTPQDGLYRCVDEAGNTEKPDGSPVSPIVKIGGVEARVHFCGLSPNTTGLYQINAEVPQGTVPGDNYLWIGEDKDANPLSPIYKLWTR